MKCGTKTFVNIASLDIFSMVSQSLETVSCLAYTWRDWKNRACVPNVSPYGPWSKAIHYIGIRVPVGMQVDYKQ